MPTGISTPNLKFLPLAVIKCTLLTDGQTDGRPAGCGWTVITTAQLSYKLIAELKMTQVTTNDDE